MGSSVCGPRSGVQGLGQGHMSRIKAQGSRINNITLLTLPPLIFRLLKRASSTHTISPGKDPPSGCLQPSLSTTPSDAISGLQGQGYRAGVSDTEGQGSRLTGHGPGAPTSLHCHPPPQTVPSPHVTPHTAHSGTPNHTWAPVLTVLFYG